MILLVKKYGGTSIGSIEKIKDVAVKIKEDKDLGASIVVVVSAMSGYTNNFIEMANSISEFPNEREMDVLLSSGEQITIALLAMALHEIDCDCVSYTGMQAGIHTDSSFNKARITNIEVNKIRKDLKNNRVVIVAGFQGVDSNNNITTLGRGGSDTTAIALAVSIQANECQIYTDVSGIYTCDPRIIKNARKINNISYEEMIELAGSGSKVLQIRSVSFVGKFRVPVRVLSSFDDSDKQGTLVYFDKDKDMEKTLITGIALDKDEAQLTIFGIKDEPGVASTIISSISKENIVIDMIVQNSGHNNKTDFTFTVNNTDYKKSLIIAKEIAKSLDAERVCGNDTIAKLSVVGVGIRSNAGVAQKMFETLAENNINILMISTSEIKISIIIDEKNLVDAAKCLHRVFDLHEASN